MKQKIIFWFNFLFMYCTLMSWWWTAMQQLAPQGLVRIFFIPRLKTQGRNLKCQIFIQHFFKIVLYWCLDLIRHNIGAPLKHNKYIFDIPIPFCHNLYLSATFNRICRFWNHLLCCLHVRAYQIPTCDLIRQFDQSDRTCGIHM